MMLLRYVMSLWLCVFLVQSQADDKGILEKHAITLYDGDL